MIFGERMHLQKNKHVQKSSSWNDGLVGPIRWNVETAEQETAKKIPIFTHGAAALAAMKVAH